jgi:hypothetical protein
MMNQYGTVSPGDVHTNRAVTPRFQGSTFLHPPGRASYAFVIDPARRLLSLFEEIRDTSNDRYVLP